MSFSPAEIRATRQFIKHYNQTSQEKQKEQEIFKMSDAEKRRMLKNVREQLVPLVASHVAQSKNPTSRKFQEEVEGTIIDVAREVYGITTYSVGMEGFNRFVKSLIQQHVPQYTLDK